MTTLLIDLSHHNNEPDWAALKAGGIAGVILKASEGTSFADPVFAAWRAAAHAAGLAVGLYGFADLGSAAAEAAWFARVIGSLQPGEFVGLDEEVTRTGVDPVVWAGQWIDALVAAGIPVRLLYINKSFLAAHDWSPIVARGVLLWLADYDNSPTAAAPHGAWPTVTLKQYTDAGHVPGETGPVDVDALAGALTDLTGDDMPTADEIAAAVWNYSLGAKDGYGPGPASVWVQDTRAQVGSNYLMLRGADPDHDNIWLLWAGLYGQGPLGNNNVILAAVADIAAKLANLQTGGVDVQSIAAAVVAAVDADLAKRFGPATPTT